MLFNTFTYGVFFALVVTLYYGLPRHRRWPLLLVASYVFYGWWSAPYLVLIAFSTTVDWGAGLAMDRVTSRRAKKAWLGVSLLSNLGLLSVFKYWGFFHGAVADLLAVVSVPYTPPALSLLLPVGISFYTFQTLSYSIDVYRGRAAPERNLFRFALYVSFFPQLVAGPIERATHLLPQIRSGAYEANASEIASGARQALWGLFKKVVIADRLAIYVDNVYGNVEVYQGSTLLLATYAFAFQIYADFSGYSDIAIGCARILGFDLRKNFDRPYLATSIRDFWRRWHISLSFWLRDYLYVSLGGNRVGRTRRNLMITMVLGGLWHGAGWTFVIWGALQGVLLIASRDTQEMRDRLWSRLGAPAQLQTVVRIVVTFHLVCLSWIFFRAASLSDALVVLEGIATSGLEPPRFLYMHTLAHAAMGLAVLAIAELAPSMPKVIATRARDLVVAPTARWAGAAALIILIVLLGVEGESQFIYFQF